MRRIILLMLAVMLCGCSSSQSLQQRLSAECRQAEELTINVRPDNVKKLYSYYAEPSIGRRQSTVSGNLFVMNHDEFVMNLNIADIVNQKLYDQPQQKVQAHYDHWLASEQGEFTDVNGEVQSYSVALAPAEQGQVFVLCQTPYFSFSGLSNETSAPQMASQMIRMARTAIVNVEEVLHSYSLKTQISYVKKNLNLIEEQIPESGRIEEMMPNKGDSTEQIDQSGDSYHDGGNADNLPFTENDDSETTE